MARTNANVRFFGSSIVVFDLDKDLVRASARAAEAQRELRLAEKKAEVAFDAASACQDDWESALERQLPADWVKTRDDARRAAGEAAAKAARSRDAARADYSRALAREIELARAIVARDEKATRQAAALEARRLQEARARRAAAEAKEAAEAAARAQRTAAAKPAPEPAPAVEEVRKPRTFGDDKSPTPQSMRGLLHKFGGAAAK